MKSTRQGKLIGLVGAVVGLAMAAGGVGAQPVKELGGEFERIEAGKPAGWREHTWSGRASFGVEAGRDGMGVTVSSEAGADAGWTTVVAVKPFAKYVLSGWIRTKDIDVSGKGGGGGVVLNVHGRREHTRPLTGTNEWTKVECEIETGAEDSLQVNCVLGYFGNAKGTAWYDGVTLTLVSAKAVEASVVVDGSKVREPMSKYIYAQFIEHLGRCIYGGIWAEMLEDRKFFYGVGSNDSPWKAVGGAKVVMEEKGAFSGDHSPKIEGASGGGMAQQGLGVEAGKAYVGTIWVDGEAEVRLVWGEGKEERAVAKCGGSGGGFTKSEFRFEIQDSKSKTGGDAQKGAEARKEIAARLEVVKVGEGPVRVGAVSLMPADHVKGMRADTLKLLKELDSPLYRWPGGNFVSGYEWRDGIGDRDRRPTRKNPAWKGIDSNDFGVHEFMVFCEEIGTEPLVVVNTGFGDSYSGAQWVEYMNGGKGTPMGAWREKNGRAEPWKIEWWGVGNEMWGAWQLGYMSVDQYVIKHNDFVKRMRAVDPTIKVVGSSDLAGGWTEKMLKGCSNTMDLISEHFYCQERPGVAGHVAQVPAAIRAKAEAHREYRKRLPELKGKDIRIAMDEWNYWYGPEVFGELGTRYFVKDALGIAAGLNEYSRCTDVVLMANYAQTVNVIGAIKTDKTRAWMETTGEVLAMYRKHFGTLPVAVEGEMGMMDVAAAWSEDKRWFTVAVVNPTAAEAGVKVAWKGVGVGEGLGDGMMWTLGGSDPQAYNDAGKPDVVKVEEGKAGAPGGELRVPGYSVRLWRWKVAR